MSRSVPASVMATKCCPAWLALPVQRCSSLAQKYRSRAHTSGVLPDLEATTNRVRSRSIEVSTAATAAGSVQSSTNTLSQPAAGPNTRANTSAGSALPPMPSSTARRNPALRTCSAKAAILASSPSMSLGALSQPRLSLTPSRALPAGAKAAASLAQMLAGMPLAAKRRYSLSTRKLRAAVVSMAAILAMRRPWRPPAKPVDSQVSTISKTSLSARMRPPKHRTLVLLSKRERRAASTLVGAKARMPRTFPAAMAVPCPVAHTSTPTEPTSLRTALATRAAYSG